MSRLFVLLLAAVAITLVSAAIDADLVSNLPGFGTPATTQYSGLIAADSANSVYLHYWLVESSGNAATDPLVLWLNGGPGCSSLEGFLYELGPLHFNGSVDAAGVPHLVANPYSWSNVANYLFLESPAGVGFSYNVNGSLDANDEITSQNNYQFLLNFFAAFPEYAARDFYITGESYAGIYIPTLVKRIDEGNNAGNKKINLIGFAVGNGCWGNGVGTCQFGNKAALITADFFHGHVWISPASWMGVTAACGYNLSYPEPSDACLQAVAMASQDYAGAPYDVYNIYNDCPNLLSNPLHKDYQAMMGRMAATASSAQVGHHKPRPRAPRRHAHEASPARVGTPDFCLSPSLASTWLQDPTVQEALHITKSNLTSWSVCFNLNYDRTTDNLLPVYPSLLQNYRALIYSGETDACVPYVGTEEWVRSLGYPVSTPWYPWGVDGEIAGYATYYKAPKGLVFATVKHAGHMVPQYMPAQGLALFSRWLINKEL